MYVRVRAHAYVKVSVSMGGAGKLKRFWHFSASAGF